MYYRVLGFVGALSCGGLTVAYLLQHGAKPDDSVHIYLWRDVVASFVFSGLLSFFPSRKRKKKDA